MGRFIELSIEGTISEVKSLTEHFGTSDIYSKDYEEKLFDYFDGIVEDFQEIINTLNDKYKNNTTVGLKNGETFTVSDNSTGEIFMEIGVGEDGIPKMNFYDNLKVKTIENLQGLSVSNMTVDEKIEALKGVIGGFNIENNQISTDLNPLMKVESNKVEMGDLIVANNLKVRGAIICTLAENMTVGQEITLGGMRVVKGENGISIYYDSKVHAKDNIYLYGLEEENRAVEKGELDELEDYCHTSIENLTRNLKGYFETYNLPYSTVSIVDTQVNKKGVLEYIGERNITKFPDYSDSRISVNFNRSGENVLLNDFLIEIDKDVSDTDLVFLKGVHYFNSAMDTGSDTPGYVADSYYSGPLQEQIDNSAGVTMDDIMTYTGGTKRDGFLNMKLEFEVNRSNGKYLNFVIEFTGD